jgi:hypothetical protein
MLSAPLIAAAALAATAPTNGSPPAVSGAAQQGQTLTASTGSWSGDSPISYMFRWQRCNGSGASCGDISGATGQTHSVGSSDVGHTLRIVVTATNLAGSSSAASSPTAVVASVVKPQATKQPDPHGTAQVGQTVSVDNGTWTGTSPISFTYQWQRCNSAGTCTNLGGATKSSYVPVTSDTGYRLRAVVTAKNSAGSTSIASNVSAAVLAAVGAPANTAKPSISGSSVNVGSTLTGSVGSWSGTQPIAFALSWQRCDSSGAHCQTISGATGSTYTLGSTDAGARIVFVVRGSNAGGANTASSSPTGVVTADPDGAIHLENGKVSIPVTSVALPNRLVISAAAFSRYPLRSRKPFIGRFRIVDTRGYVVRDVLVRALGLPNGWVAASREVVTGVNGIAAVRFVPTRRLPLKRSETLAIYVRARKAGDSTLAGISTRRLFQVQLAPPRRR